MRGEKGSADGRRRKAFGPTSAIPGTGLQTRNPGVGVPSSNLRSPLGLSLICLALACTSSSPPAPAPTSGKPRTPPPREPAQTAEGGSGNLAVPFKPGEPVRTVWLARERVLRPGPFEPGDGQTVLPFNTELLLLETPDLGARARESMQRVYPVRVSGSGEQGWISVDMEEPEVFREQAVTIDALRAVIETVRVGLATGGPVTYDALGVQLLGLGPLGERPATMDPTPLIADHLQLQRLHYGMAPDALPAICGLVSALSLSQQNAELPALQAKAATRVGDPLQRWLSRETLTELRAVQQAHTAVRTDEELLKVYGAFSDLLDDLQAAAASDFDPLSNRWCTGSDGWVRAAVPGLEVDSGPDSRSMDMPGNRYELTLWLDAPVWNARAASTEGSVDDDVLALRGAPLRELELLVDDMDVGCLNLGDPERLVLARLQQMEALSARGDAVHRLLQRPRARLFDQLAAQPHCDGLRAPTPPRAPLRELADIQAEIALSPDERAILERLTAWLTSG